MIDQPPPPIERRTSPAVDPVAASAALDYFMAEAYCARLSEITGNDLADVRGLCAQLSGNLRPLLHSPQGWLALAGVMVDDRSILSAPIVSSH